MKNDRNEVKLWQSRLEKNLTAYEGELEKMRKREAQYKGDRTMQPLTEWPESGKAVGCVTVYAGDVRLIDNITY